MRLANNLCICFALSLLIPKELDAQLVTLHMEQGDIRIALDAVNKQTGTVYIDPQGILRKGKKIDINVRSEFFITVLKILSEGQPYRFQILDNTIMVVVRDEFEKAIASGRVLDQ